MAKKSSNQQTVSFPYTLGVRLDWDTLKEIGIIGLFDKKKPGTWARDVLVAKVQTYLRRHDYNRFKRQLETERNRKNVG